MVRDGQDHQLLKIKSPKHCDLEDQDHFTFSTQREVVGNDDGGGGAVTCKLKMLNAVSVLTSMGNGSADFANNVRHLTQTFVAILLV